ncbi:Uncharacterised protein [Mycobacteroides abscessus subsp. abscessus]|nr:Uncharacterised protein [Mycobacteroides abscessus subsp. abscessus]
MSVVVVTVERIEPSSREWTTSWMRCPLFVDAPCSPHRAMTLPWPAEIHLMIRRPSAGASRSMSRLSPDSMFVATTGPSKSAL